MLRTLKSTFIEQLNFLRCSRMWPWRGCCSSASLN